MRVRAGVSLVKTPLKDLKNKPRDGLLAADLCGLCSVQDGNKAGEVDE